MADDVLTIGSKLEHDDAEPLIVDSFLTQRSRLLASARSLDAAEWGTPSRCSAWTAHQLLIHVLGATESCRTTLTGTREVFAGGFDPNSGPTSFVDSRAGEPVATTLDDLDAELARTADAIDALRGVSPTPTRTAVWGAQIDWRLFLVHMFWDGWMHERDLLLPLDRPVTASPAEAQLAVAYGLHSAGMLNGLIGNPIDVTLQLGGTGGGTYRVVARDDEVVVTVEPPGDGAMGDAPVVTDAIAGRPPALTEVLDAPPDAIDALARLGGFLSA